MSREICKKIKKFFQKTLDTENTRCYNGIIPVRKRLQNGDVNVRYV